MTNPLFKTRFARSIETKDARGNTIFEVYFSRHEKVLCTRLYRLKPFAEDAIRLWEEDAIIEKG
jgi:hypothetical protein